MTVDSPDEADEADETDHLCPNCRKLKLHTLFPRKGDKHYWQLFRRLLSRRKPYEPWKKHKRIRPGNPACPLCQMFSIIEASLGAGLSELNMYESHLCSSWSHQDDCRGMILVPIPPPGDLRRPFGRRLHPLQINWEVMRGCISSCEQSHKLCTEKHDLQAIKLKVIDCKTRSIVQAPNMPVYACLSYVWGAAQVEEYGKDEDNNHLPPTLPKVVQDAMLATYHLGFRYLWVDRYCIPQHDAHEKMIQIATMGKIYAAAAVTIIAAAGDGPNHGLPGVSTTPRREQPRIRLGHNIWIHHNIPGLAIGKSKWNSRAWTFQEGLLSRRRLVFTHEEAYFECHESFGMEHFSEMFVKIGIDERSGGSFFPSTRYHDAHISQPSRKNGILRAGYRISEFLKRDLSYDMDALNACQGVLETFEELNPRVFHLYGLPMYFSGHSAAEALAIALGWTTQCRMTRRAMHPSWTWAGWKRAEEEVYDRPYFDVPHPGAAIPEVYPFLNGIGSCRFVSATWEMEAQGIIEGLDWSNPPTRLHIRGWIFDASICRENGAWGFQYPKSLNDRDLVEDGDEPTYKYRASCSALFRLFDDSTMGRDDDGISHSVLGLVLGCREYWNLKDRWVLTFTYLLLKRMEGGECFERIECLSGTAEHKEESAAHRFRRFEPYQGLARWQFPRLLELGMYDGDLTSYFGDIPLRFSGIEFT